MKQITLKNLFDYKKNGNKFACLTAYDACFAHAVSSAGVEVILVGDSLGMVLQGHDSTLPVTVDDMAYHMACVKRGNQGALLMVDLPFMSYANEEKTLENAAVLMQQGAQIVKLEGGAWLADTTRLLVERGIPVCAHMGLTPQSINRIGGYRVQGRDPKAAENMINEALTLQAAGASIILLECVPQNLAKKITDALEVPVIGIGAGKDTDGQIMVLHDMLGITPSKAPKFVKNFLEGTDSIEKALENYVTSIKAKEFPADKHCYD